MSLGMVYSLSRDDKPLGYITFQGVFSGGQKKWHKRDEYFGQVMEVFLITHRNHELRVVPEGVDEELDAFFGGLKEIEADDYLRASFDYVEEVDAEKELNEWIVRLRDRRKKE